METLWTKMAKLFGPAWTTSFGDADDGTWARALAGFNGQDLARGMANAMNANLAFPPNASQFRALCLQRDQTPEQRAANALARDMPSLEDFSKRVSSHATGRKLVAFWITEGLVKDGFAGMSLKEAEDVLRDEDVDAMREQVARHTSRVKS